MLALLCCSFCVHALISFERFVLLKITYSMLFLLCHKAYKLRPTLVFKCLFVLLVFIYLDNRVLVNVLYKYVLFDTFSCIFISVS